MSIAQKSSKSFVEALTAIRAYFSVWLVLFHFSVVPLVALDLEILRQGRYATDFFLILSGFVISLVYFERLKHLTRSDFQTFIVKRLAKLYPLHLLTFLVFVAMRLAYVGIGRTPTHPEDYSLHSAILNLLLLQGWVPGVSHSWNYVSWSLSAEFFAYLVLFPFMLLKGRYWPFWLRTALVLGLYAIYVSAGSLRELVPYYLFRIGFCFIFGVYLYQSLPFFARWKDRSRLWSRLFLYSLLSGLAIAQWFAKDGYAYVLIDLLWGLVIVALYFVRGWTQAVISNRWARRVGSFSFSTYLIHGAISKVIFALTDYVGEVSPYQSFANLLLALIITLWAAKLVQKYFTDPAGDYLLKLWEERKQKVKQEDPALAGSL